VSRHTARRQAKRDELIDELSLGAAQRLRCESDDIHGVVTAVVDYLLAEYPSQELYIPATERAITYPVQRLRAALAAGESMRSICKRFRMSRRTVYRALDEQDPESDSD
jgi:hypothetical protein